jgi:hypothetical protein
VSASDAAPAPERRDSGAVEELLRLVRQRGLLLPLDVDEAEARRRLWEAHGRHVADDPETANPEGT